MNDDSLLKQGLLGIGTLGKQVGKGVSEESKKTVKSVGQQVVGIESAPDANAENPGREKTSAMQANKSKENQELLKAMYGKSETDSANTPLTGVSQDNQKLAQLRQQFQRDYWERTFNSPKREPEEKPAEKVEREKEEERWKLQEKEKKKPPPLAVSREQNKTESRVGSG